MLFSRVRTGKKLFALGLNDTTIKSTQPLRQLKHSTQIILWEQGYDSTGRWNPAFVQTRAETMARDHAARKKKASKIKRSDQL